MSAHEIYCGFVLSTEGLQSERQDLITTYIYIGTILAHRFKFNKNLDAALAYLNKVFSECFRELTLDYEWNIKVTEYFESFDNLEDITDEELLEEIDSITMYYEDLLPSRIAYLAKLTDHYLSIAESGILTNLNYYFECFPRRVSDDIVRKHLSVISK